MCIFKIIYDKFLGVQLKMAILYLKHAFMANDIQAIQPRRCTCFPQCIVVVSEKVAQKKSQIQITKRH